jgi:hypothetical protein
MTYALCERYRGLRTQRLHRPARHKGSLYRTQLKRGRWMCMTPRLIRIPVGLVRFASKDAIEQGLDVVRNMVGHAITTTEQRKPYAGGA